MKNNAQSSIEFIIVISTIIFFFSVTLITIQQIESDKKIEAQYIELLEVAKNVQEEIILANLASDGYERNFILPQRVAGLNYNLEIIGNYLEVRSENGKHSFSIDILNVTGNINVGDNLIRKINGSVYLN